MFRRFPSGGMDPDCPRLAPSMKASVTRTPGVDANVAGGYLPVPGTRAPEGRFSVLTVVCSARSSATLIPRPWMS